MSRRAIQLTTLAYWLPALGVDYYIIWMWGWTLPGFALAFQVLFKEALGYLAAWLVVGGLQAMLFSRIRPTRKPRRAVLKTGVDVGVQTLNRERRGL